MNHLKANIKFLRLSSGLTLDYMAKFCNLRSKSAFRAYEIGACDPPIPNLIRMSSLFDVTIDDLIKKDLSQTTLTNTK
jgi:transcriptional regulator with XRE-family HTH domain